MTILYSVGGLIGNLSLEEQVIVAKQAGFDGVDYIASHKDLFFPPERIMHLTKKYGIKVRSVHIPVLLVLHIPQLLFNKIIKLINYFPESKRFNFHLSGFVNPLGKHISELEKFRQVMRENKIDISCESNPDEYLIFKYFPKETYNPELFAQFCIVHKLPINLDTSHIASWNYDIVEFFKKYRAHINLIHLSDMTSDKQHLPLGKGKLPLNKFFEEIKKHSYNSIIIFEVSNFSKNTPKEQMINELKNNIHMIKKVFYNNIEEE